MDSVIREFRGQDKGHAGLFYDIDQPNAAARRLDEADYCASKRAKHQRDFLAIRFGLC